ncbi:hypothetical protein [Leptospira vanthielii]|uniref:Uncharacterized protein n=1 Tax=Leptospira vanthielii serovar Holland str. Waz Holland = ATCC 700522 TaxID=1218591 RepID=N1W1Z3_9LEPT|nr:hypothetical protein [Leptospira vanthielii]EMY70249.1 hypothetical protein LEP1GSC199_3255 [Leptospira vanthielii serovar Holland str. Waz Holland = ATCC 700522]
MKILFPDFLLWLLSIVSLIFYFSYKVELSLIYGIVFLEFVSLIRIGWVLYRMVVRRKQNVSFYVISILSLLMNGINGICLFFIFLLALGFTGSH